jgi:glycosyltransferase involved in cell wall biosynthesis
MTKVLYILNQYPSTSLTFIRREILELEKNGVEVERVGLRGWDAELVDDVDKAEHAKTRFVLNQGLPRLLLTLMKMAAFSPGRFLSAARLCLRMTRRSYRPQRLHAIYFLEACYIAMICKETKSQFIHAHFGTNSAEVAMLVSVLTALPFSFTVHGPDEFDAPEFWGFEEKVGRAAFVCAISSYTRSQLMRWTHPKNWEKITVVRCGLDDAYKTMSVSPEFDANNLINVGRLNAQKGHGILLAAAAKVVKSHPQMRLSIVGDGELRPLLTAQIARLGLEQNVHLLGWFDSASVRQSISNAKGLVLSSFAEGLPVVIMEAMAAGRPVITTTVGGIPELVRHGEDGWLCPAGSEDALASAMIELLDAPAQRVEAMGRSARSRCLEHHDISIIAAQLKELFNRGARGLAPC